MMNKGCRITIFSILMIFIFSSFSGCIHIDLGDPFKPEESEPPEYHIVAKEGFPISHSFNLQKSIDPTHSDTMPIRVKSGTEWVNISIKVVINDFNIINNSPIENYTQLDRYVEVTIDDPNAEQYYNKRFSESDEVRRQLSTPAPGPWVVKVEAVGLGWEDTEDSYLVDVIANEPV
jgi:hypothetical protein